MSTTSLSPGDKTARGETVQAFCPADPVTNVAPDGHWRCDTHDEDFPSNFSMDSHVATGNHAQVWICHTHGAEAAS